MKKDYRQFMEARAEKFAWFIIENEATIRGTAEHFHVSKSLVHHDVTKILLMSNSILASEVRKVLEKNKKARHIRGGMANKRKYELKALGLADIVSATK